MTYVETMLLSTDSGCHVFKLELKTLKLFKLFHLDQSIPIDPLSMEKYLFHFSWWEKIIAHVTQLLPSTGDGLESETFKGKDQVQSVCIQACLFSIWFIVAHGKCLNRGASANADTTVSFVITISWFWYFQEIGKIGLKFRVGIQNLKHWQKKP